MDISNLPKPRHTQSTTETQVKMAFTVCSPPCVHHRVFTSPTELQSQCFLWGYVGAGTHGAGSRAGVHVPGVANWEFPCSPQEVKVFPFEGLRVLLGSLALGKCTSPFPAP